MILKYGLVLFCLFQGIQANPLDTFFKSLGAGVNSTTGGSFHDQASGYYTGGGYVLRQGSSGIQPINISLPRFGIGCNNLDLYFGSFSFIKSENLVKLLREVGTGIPTYGFQLALKAMSPQIENLTSQIRKYIQDMNALMLNSCQSSQQIVGGLWPKGTAASEQICMDQKRSSSVDWFGARSHCKDGESIQSGLDTAKEKYKDLLVGEYNLVWHVIKKITPYANNKDLAHFVLSITGTLISEKGEEGYRLRVIEPRADQKDFINAYLKGGNTTILSCGENDQTKCLKPVVKEITIGEESTMKSKVHDKILTLRNKYIEKSNITEEELIFLNDTVNLPVYKYIQVSVAAGTPFIMQEAVEYIGAMVLLTQFDRVMSEIIEAVDALQKIQLEDSSIQSFKKNLQQARSRVQALLIGANSGSIAMLNEAIQSIERSIISRNS